MARARSVWLLGGTFGALLALFACQDEPPQLDYTKRFPIGAQPETVTVTLSVAGASVSFAGEAGAQFDTLVAGYLDRGHGPLVVTAAAPPQGGERGRTQLQAVRNRLVASGVPASAIRTQLAAQGAANTVTLSYQRFDVVLPTCGDWSAPLQANPSNADYPGFGCALQRNLGQMLADPADAVTMRAAAPSDTQNLDRVIRAYRSGTPLEAKQGALQDYADQNAASGGATGNQTPVPTSSTR